MQTVISFVSALVDDKYPLAKFSEFFAIIIRLLRKFSD